MELLKVLVVDDEARMRKLVKDFLSVKGFLVVEAEDGEQALEMFFAQKDIALVILDVMMPKMDGWEVCKTIRQYSQVPVMMLTARGEESCRALNWEWMSIFLSLSALRFWWRGWRRSCAEARERPQIHQRQAASGLTRLPIR